MPSHTAPKPHRVRTWPRRGIVTFAIGATIATLFALVLTLALPVDEWRTGDQGLMPPVYRPATPLPPGVDRLWIDTDAACGASPKTDPDDCLAIALVAASPRFTIAGLSTTFGNASLDVVNATLDALLAEARRQTGRALPRFSGAATASMARPRATAATQALTHALEDGPLVVLALGPLTNLADVVRARPDLRSRIVQVIAVMGRRPGHLFHPAAGAHARSFFGHGPVMRDFNYAMDPAAVETVLAAKLPLTLVPYDAAVGVEIDDARLHDLARTGRAMRFATERAHDWLRFWQQDMGRAGFYPFDLVAAAYLVAPGAFGCARVGAEVTTDPSLFVAPFRARGLLVTHAPAAVTVQYCGKADETLSATIVRRASGNV